MLKQNHHEFDSYTVMETVLMGNTKLYQIMKEKEVLYSKTDFSDDDGIRLGELEGEFAELNGWEAESDAAELLENLGVEMSYHYTSMSEVPNNLKVKVLLAQVLFGNPDILLLDEPTNDLDLDAINWLQEFIINYPNTVVVVSHDRYFLNKVCTHILDIDYKKIKLYVGNYDFWYESSELALKQMKEANKKKEEKIKELEAFIARFSANASKSKQATSRKKMLDKIVLDEIVPSTRKYPFIEFKPSREIGKEVLSIIKLVKDVGDKRVINKINIEVMKEDKIGIIGDNLTKTLFFNLLMGIEKFNAGSINYGSTIIKSYFPQDNSQYFTGNETLMEWIGQFYDGNDDTVLRGFLGRMLFSGDDVFKTVNVLSGGEKVRLKFAELVQDDVNLLLLDEPTNHLDIRSREALEKALAEFDGTEIFVSHDRYFINQVANRVAELEDGELTDFIGNYDEYREQKARSNPFSGPGGGTGPSKSGGPQKVLRRVQDCSRRP